LPRLFKVQLDQGALSDLEGIRDLISAERSPGVANAFIGRVIDHLSGFDTFPNRGVRRDDIRPGLRLIGWRRTLTIAFSVDEFDAIVVIFAILYRGRDIETALRSREA